MHRLLVRLSALALSTAALAACGSDQVLPAPAQGDNGATVSTAQTLDDEIRGAQLLRVKGDYTGALRALGQLMLVAPDDPRIVGEYGKVLVQQGRPQEAVNFLKRAVELQPNDWTLYSALGVAYDQTQDPVKARDAYQRALVLKPGEAVVLNNFALSRMLAGDPAQAKALMAEASAAGAANPKIARNMALINGLAGSKMAVAAPTSTPQTQAPAEPGAVQAPKPLALAKIDAKAGRRDVVMQRVPFDPLAGPVANKSVKLVHTPRKLAKTHKAQPATAAAVRSTIPALRLANDRP